MIVKILISILIAVLIGIHMYSIRKKTNWYYYPEKGALSSKSSLIINKFVRSVFGVKGVTVFGVIQILIILFVWIVLLITL